MSKILICGCMTYATPFNAFGETTNNVSDFFAAPEKYSLVVFTGGEDVDPSIYGDEKNGRCGWTNPQRDKFEISVFKVARDTQIPLAGICRGSQFLCAMAGGKLVQHCTNHCCYHDLRTVDGRTIYVSSTHHQMMLPHGVDHVLLAWAEPKRSSQYHIGNVITDDIGAEADCVYFPNINALAMQYHPEYMSEDTEGFQYSQELVEEHLGLTRNWKAQSAS